MSKNPTMQTEEKVIFRTEGRKSSSCDVRYLKMESAPRGDSAYSLHFNYLFPPLIYRRRQHRRGRDHSLWGPLTSLWLPVLMNVSKPGSFGLELIPRPLCLSGLQVCNTDYFQSRAQKCKSYLWNSCDKAFWSQFATLLGVKQHLCSFMVTKSWHLNWFLHRYSHHDASFMGSGSFFGHRAALWNHPLTVTRKQHVLWDWEGNHGWEITASIDNLSPETSSVWMGNKVISPSFWGKEQGSKD